MHAIQKAKKIIETAPNSDEGKVLGGLILSLETGEVFQISRLYELDYKHFEIALAVIADWRLDRYYASKFRVLSAALHARNPQSP